MRNVSQHLNASLIMEQQMQELTHCEEAAVLLACCLCQIKGPHEVHVFSLIRHLTQSLFVQWVCAMRQQITICKPGLCAALSWINNSRPAQCRGQAGHVPS